MVTCQKRGFQSSDNPVGRGALPGDSDQLYKLGHRINCITPKFSVTVSDLSKGDVFNCLMTQLPGGVGW